MERCLPLHHLSLDYGGQLLITPADDTIRAAEQNWISTFPLPDLRTVFLNHAYDEDKLGENPAVDSPFWTGATSYWEKIGGRWVLCHEDLTALRRDRAEDVFCKRSNISWGGN